MVRIFMFCALVAATLSTRTTRNASKPKETETPVFVQRAWGVHRADSQHALLLSPPPSVVVLSYNVWWWGNPSSQGGWPTTDYASLPGMHAYWKTLPRLHVVGVQECDAGWPKLSSYFDGAVDYLTEVEAQQPGPLCTLYDPARLTVLGSGTVHVWEYRHLEYARLHDRITDNVIFFVNTHWDHQARDSQVHAERTAQAIIDHSINGDIVIVAGDFNLPPYIHVFPQIFEGQLGLRLEGRGSSHAQIDMIWTNHDGMSSCESPEDTGPAGTGSDHNPVLCEFDITAGSSSGDEVDAWPADTYRYVGAPMVGGWGGRCRCPSGRVYEVGDNCDSCGSLACVGGEIVEPCGQGVISKSRQGWKVTCGNEDQPAVTPSPSTATPSPSIAPTPTPSSNITATDDTYEYVGAPNVGGWGGHCKCPSGLVYEVGDNYDACGSLACIGGTVVKECGKDVIARDKAGWRVTCAAGEFDNNLNDDETADSNLSDGEASLAWTHHQGMNCYDNHGAVGIAGKDPLPGSLTLDACKSKCVEEPTCEGIVLHSQQALSTCWLRKNLDVSACVSRADTDFWERANDHGAVESDNNPDDNGLADLTWTQHPGVNCYRNHGAVGVLGKDPLPGSLTVEACKRKCVDEPTCEGIVIVSQQDMSPCFLRNNVNLSECIGPNSGYDFWARAQ